MSRWSSIFVRRPTVRPGLLPILLAVGIGLAAHAPRAQDWDSEDDNWSSSESAQSSSGDQTGFSARMGIGFTAGPDTFLLNLELPYQFDPWVSVGPAMQIGLSSDDTIWAPTANLKITVPDLPGDALDRFIPYVQGGIGFAVISDEDRRKNETRAGFLGNAGFGVDYAVSEHLFVGSQMLFNFLPGRVAGQKFFFSWEMLGVRIAF